MSHTLTEKQRWKIDYCKDNNLNHKNPNNLGKADFEFHKTRQIIFEQKFKAARIETNLVETEIDEILDTLTEGKVHHSIKGMNRPDKRPIKPLLHQH